MAKVTRRSFLKRLCRRFFSFANAPFAVRRQHHQTERVQRLGSVQEQIAASLLEFYVRLEHNSFLENAKGECTLDCSRSLAMKYKIANVKQR